MSGPTADASPATHWKRRPRATPIPREAAVRQGAITQLAFLLLGRDAAIAFLNTLHDGLGGRPLELATASAAGRADVEAELSRMTYRAPGDAGRSEGLAALPLPRAAPA